MDLKNNIKKLIFPLLILIFIAVAICYLYKPIYYRIYWGDRITGEFGWTAT